jgi:hypothetical protein
MAHSHVNEYQIRTAYQDGTEELTGWMGSEEQLAQAMATLHTVQRTTYWLRVRNVVCSDCFDNERQVIVESPITGIPSPRYRPHNSDYLLALGSRSRYELFEAVLGIRR